MQLVTVPPSKWGGGAQPNTITTTTRCGEPGSVAKACKPCAPSTIAVGSVQLVAGAVLDTAQSYASMCPEAAQPRSCGLASTSTVVPVATSVVAAGSVGCYLIITSNARGGETH